MEITIEHLENCQLRIAIELDEERTQQALQQAARSIARQAKIAGFRKGKAPYDLIVQRYGEETIRQEAAQLVAGQVYQEALEQEEIVPFAPASLDDTSLDPMAFTFTVALPPTVDLGNYRAYRLKPAKVKIDKKQIQEALERIREENAILEPAERAAALGDGVEIDFVAQTPDGTDLARREQLRFMLEAKEDEPLPDLVMNIVGMQAGEERSFTAPIPPDFEQEELRGRPARFTVTMRTVYDSTLPDLDDDLARTIGSFDSLKDLEAQVKEQLTRMAQNEADQKYEADVVEAIVEKAKAEFPPVMVEHTLDDLVEDFERTVKRQARLSLEDYLRIQNQDVEQLREEMTPAAEGQVKSALVLGEVVRREKLTVDEDEIEARIEALSAPWGVRADEMRAQFHTDTGRRTVLNRMLRDKAVERLVAIARGEKPEIGSPEETTDDE